MTFYIDTEAGNLIESDTDTSRVSLQSLVRNDTDVPVTLKPLTVTGEDTTSADFSSADTFEIIVGEYDLAPSGGTFTVSYAGNTTASLDYNISENQLEAKLSSLFRSGGKSAVTVRQISDGAWRISANSDGAISTGSVTVDDDALVPGSSGNIMEADLGSSTDPFKLVLVLRQSALAYSTPTTSVSNGRSGTLNLNTVEMWQFSQRAVGESFDVPFAIRRTRNSGEAKVIFTSPLTILKDNLNLGTAIPVDIPGSSGADINIGNTIFVDKVYGGSGSGADGTLAHPFDTIEEAVSTATSNQLIYVRVGNYTEVGNIAPDKLILAASFSVTSNAVTVVTVASHGLAAGHSVMIYFFDVLGVRTYDGIFTVTAAPTATSFTYDLAHADVGSTSLSDSGIVQPLISFYFEPGAVVTAINQQPLFGLTSTANGDYHYFSVTGSGRFNVTDSVVLQGGATAARVSIEFERMEARAVVGASSCVEGVFFSLVMRGTLRAGGYDALLAVAPSASTSEGSYVIIDAPVIEAGFDAGAPIVSGANAIEITPSTVAGALTVIRAGLIKSHSSDAIAIAPNTSAFPGSVQITAGRIEGVSSGVKFTGSGGGTVAAFNISVADEIVGSSGPGILMDSGAASGSVLRVNGRVRSSYNNAAGNPVRITGGSGTIILDRATLIPTHASAESIYAASAKTVRCPGTFTAVEPHANVTAPGLTVDSTIL